MVRIKNLVLVIAFIGSFGLSPAFSQKKAEIISAKWAATAIQADGLLSDWQDSLTLYNEATKLYYALANDDQYVYLALKSTSRSDLTKVLAGGISFSANTESDKKNPPTIIFPVLDRTPGKSRNVKEQPEEEEIQKQILSKIKDIKVRGFKEIIDGGISLQNTYGIRAAAAFDKDNNFVQEIAIPLSLLNLSSSSTDLVTYNIRVNGLQGPAGPSSGQRPMNSQRQSMGGMYGGQFPPRNNPMSKLLTATDFYIKSRLATKP